MFTGLLLYFLLGPASNPEAWQQSEAGEAAVFAFKSAPFPHESRNEGFTARDGAHFPAEQHYASRSVGLLIPKGFRDSSTISFVVHFHGHRNSVGNVMTQFRLLDQLHKSGVNAVLVIPQGPLNAPDSGFGRIEEAEGLKDLLAEALERLRGEGKTQATEIERVVLTAHSGGYRATAGCLARGGLGHKIKDVILFDATYGGLKEFAEFAAQPDTRLISIFTKHLASENFTLLSSLQGSGAPFSVFMEDQWSEQSLRRHHTVFIHTRKLTHDAVVSEQDYFSVFLKTSGLPQR
ncbi:MAG TPA: hypothetical protein PLD59_06055 [Tepidisphaeraceae bacterium]|nr:hypothetical protein [Tepidisphaeraceae bacterium]